MASSPLDAVDHAILHELQRNARKPITDIADAVDVSDNTVRNRIEAMEEADVIDGYRVDVNYDEAGVQHHYLFVCSTRVSKREQLAEEARRQLGVTEVITLMTGTHNVYVLAAGSEKDDMTKLAYDIDELGLEIEREHLIRAHVRQPYDGFALGADPDR